jgi:tripartite ATP-independent transporter DctM subunit
MFQLGLYLALPFFVLLMLNVPIALTLVLSSACFIEFSGSRIPPMMLPNDMFGSIDSVSLLALPTFVLAGELLNRCDLTGKLTTLALRVVGWVPGGLAHVSVVTAIFFGGINGSALADAASISPIMIPGLVRERYPRQVAAAIVAAAAVIGAIVPPSIPLVIIGGQLEISVSGLLLGGLVPAALIALLLMAAIFVSAWWKGYGTVHPFEGVTPLARSFLEAGPALLIPILIIGGLLLGIFSPTEAGTVTVLYTLLIGTLYYRSLDLGKFAAALNAAARVTANALLIVGAAMAFGHIVTYYQLPQVVLSLMTSLTDNRFLLLLLVVLLFIVVGMFMDPVANMIILGPLLMPICTQGLGMHPIQFGEFLMLGLLLGILHPPIGLLLFIVAPIAETSIERVALAVLPYLALEMCVLLLVGVSPEVSLAIPRLAGLVR